MQCTVVLPFSLSTILIDIILLFVPLQSFVIFIEYSKCDGQNAKITYVSLPVENQKPTKHKKELISKIV